MEEVPTESGEVEQPKPKRRAASVSFARPPQAREVLQSEVYQKKFDELSGRDRHLIKRIMDHGDLKRAAKEAGYKATVGADLERKLTTQKDIRAALLQGGLDSDSLIAHLHDCLEANTIKFDKHQNAINCTDLSLKLKTLELIFKLNGSLGGAAPPKKNNVVDLFEETDLNGD
jgi:hypothetical protein